MSLYFARPIYLLTLLCLIPLIWKWWTTTTSLTPRRSRGALALRALSILCLCLAISGANISATSDRLTVLYLLDRSLSTGGDSEIWQRKFINTSLQEKGKEDKFGVVLFGAEPGLELRAGNYSRKEIGTLTTVVDRGSSQLTTALRFAATAFPGESSRRLVVLTDGMTTESEVQREVKSLSDAGIDVWLVPMPDVKNVDVLLSRFEAPAQVSLNEPFLIRTVIESKGIGECQLLITENGRPKQKLSLKLKEGPNLFLLPQRKVNSGAVKYEARVIAENDTSPENNKGESLTLVGGEQTVVVLRSQEGPGSLVPLLRNAGLKAVARQPSTLPKSVGSWRDVSCLIIEDVDSLAWSKRLQTVVSLLVREGGMGLVMCGSDSTFGVGAYQKTPIESLLPVNLSIRRPKDQPLSALIQLLDKSGSMGGEPIKMAREAAIAAGETVSERDMIGVVGFDSAARWVVPFAAKGDGSKLRDGVSRLRAGGGTNLYPALNEALSKLSKTDAPLKHIIVLSDGVVAGGAYDQLIDKANKLKVTISAVALGQGADIKFLEDLTRKGKGRLFRSANTVQGSTLAQIFIRDTVLATGSGIQEKPMEVRATQSGSNSPILATLNIQNSPKLRAHNMASPKGGTSQTLLHTKKKDPILAVGRAGLGRTAAWLSDLGGDWAEPWDKTSSPIANLSLLETILLRTVRGTVSSSSLPLKARGNRLEVKPRLIGDSAVLEVELKTRNPLPGPVTIVSISPDGESSETVLQTTGPFSAVGSLRLTQAGSGLLLAQDDQDQLLGKTNFSIPLAPEFTRLGTDLAAMKRWALDSGSKFDPRPEDVFQKAETSSTQRTPLEKDLARGVLLLLLLEVAVRRLPLPKIKGRKSQALETKTEQIQDRFSQLRAVKKSLKTPTKSSRKPKPKIKRLAKKPKPKSTEKVKGESPSINKPQSTESTLAKLKKARKGKKT